MTKPCLREGLDWANVDFGMDLQKCIDMFEKPMAFLAIFEEESLFPKATNATFAEKLMTNLLGKWTQFTKPNPRYGQHQHHCQNKKHHQDHNHNYNHERLNPASSVVWCLTPTNSLEAWNPAW